MSTEDLRAGLTIVVNFHPKQPDWSLGTGRARRFIGKTPIYNLSAMQVGFSGGDVILATGDCKQDVRHKLHSDAYGVWDAIRALGASDYNNSLWCQTSSGFWLPCDSYLIGRWPTPVRGNTVDNVYVKFGMSKTGKCVVVISCHPSSEDEE